MVILPSNQALQGDIMNTPKDYFSWIQDDNEAQKSWASKYLAKRSIHVSSDDNGAGNLIGERPTFSERLNQFLNHHNVKQNVDKKELSRKMRRAWGKQKERINNTEHNLKPVSFTILNRADDALNRLAKKKGTTRSETLELLILAERELDAELDKQARFYRKKIKEIKEKHQNEIDTKKIFLKGKENKIDYLNQKIKKLESHIANSLQG